MTYKQAPGSGFYSSRTPDTLTQYPSPNVQVKKLLAEAATEIAASGIDTARLDAEILLAHTLTIDRTRLLARLSSPISQDKQEIFQRLIERRIRREPIAYITGKREFWSREFCVTPDVLIPRPETEFVVETVLQLVAQPGIANPRSLIQILDIGTGSGCIAITLAKELPTAELWAVDLSSAALTVALDNAQRHGVDKRIRFLQGDLFSSIHEALKFDIVVSNPPYIARDDLTALQPEVRDWEPKAALDGGKDGLTFYCRLVQESQTRLRSGGWLIMEMGVGQCSAVTRLIQAQSNFQESLCVQDYTGFDRVVAARSCA